MQKSSDGDLEVVVLFSPALAGLFYVGIRWALVFSTSHLRTIDLSLSQIVRLGVGVCVGLFFAGVLQVCVIVWFDELFGKQQASKRRSALIFFLGCALATAAYLVGFEFGFRLRLSETGSRLEALISALYSWVWVLLVFCEALTQWIQHHWNRPVGVALQGFWRNMMWRA